MHNTTDDDFFDLIPGEQPTTPEDNEPTAIGDDDEQVRELDRAVRRKLFQDTLAVLSNKQRRIIEAIAFEGLTLHQIAEQIGHPYKIVWLHCTIAVRTLAVAGKVSPELARVVGLDVKEMASRAPGRIKAEDTKARRELVAEAMSIGWSVAKIAREIGYPLGTIAHDAATIRKRTATTTPSEPCRA